jgi:hypothetical protein
VNAPKSDPADTPNTLAARAACPWLSVDESLGLPGWLLEQLHAATAADIRGRMLMMGDLYFLSVLGRRLEQLEDAS